MTFRVGITRDYLVHDDRPVWPGLGVDGFEGEAGLEVEFLPEKVRRADRDLIDRYDALISSTLRYDEASFAGIERLLIVARFGVGYDTIDLEAATRAGVMVTVTRGAADRPVAEGALTLMLALGHQVVNKDRLTREGRWNDRLQWTGVELRDRTIGVIGLGGIGRELFRLLQPFGIARALAYDPYADAAAAPGGVELAPLDTLLRESDFISIHCLLTEETRHLIGERELSLMKPSAFLINTARGPVVDQHALTRALSERRIRGAALDVFDDEPIDPGDPLLVLDNVIVTPHAVAVTEELYRDYHRSCARQILDVKHGRVPPHVVNRQVLDNERLLQRLAAIQV